MLHVIRPLIAIFPRISQMTMPQPKPITHVGSDANLTFSIAGNRQDRCDAYRLVYENYLEKGLIQENPYRMRVTPYHLLPSTSVFVARLNGSVICTVSLIGDGQLGLPMESIYSGEVQASRDKGLYVGEISCLAVRDIAFKCFLPVFLKLTRLMTQFARSIGMNQFLIAVHPKHARFYKRYMGFEQVGEYREYPSVCNAPAVAYCLDFARIDRDRPPCYDEYFSVPIPLDQLRPQELTCDEMTFFSRVMDQSRDCVPLSA